MCCWTCCAACVTKASVLDNQCHGWTRNVVSRGVSDDAGRRGRPVNASNVVNRGPAAEFTWHDHKDPTRDAQSRAFRRLRFDG